jgi:hypothetical protein
MTPSTSIPEQDWQQIQLLSDRIKHREWEQEEDIRNLNNLLHALHGEGVRGSEYTSTGKPMVFVEGNWVER